VVGQAPERRGSGDPWYRYLELRRRALAELTRHQDLQYVAGPGLFGALPAGEGGRGGALWVLEVSARDVLAAALDSAAPDWLALAESALPLQEVARERGWTQARAVVAMARPALDDLPPVEMPIPYALQHVDTQAQDPERLSVEEALLVDVLHGDSEVEHADRDLPAEAGLLRGLPGVSLHVAVDAGGSCVASAGVRLLGDSALICAVATIPAARRHGLATALTTAALHAARDAGATAAFLDAAGGASIYRRLGFTDLGVVVRCERPPARSPA
jgi:ribosomal protein S18 acetylase RimI-like enzyme